MSSKFKRELIDIFFGQPKEKRDQMQQTFEFQKFTEDC